MKELLYKTIKRVYIDNDKQHFLKFETTDGNIIYQTDGDCCSETWFADLIGIENLINQQVLNVEEVPMIDVSDDPRTRQEYDKIYCYKLTTTTGYTDIIFRNSSNGYYGGNLEIIPEEQAKTWNPSSRKSDIDVNFVEVTGDYST